MSRPLRVFAAGSLRPAFEPSLVGPTAWPGGPVDFRYANARDLAHAIERGDPADVFASASSTDPARLEAAGRLTRVLPFARNRVVIGVSTEQASRVADVADVARPGTRVVIEIAGVPLGDYTREALRRLDQPDLADAILSNVVSEEVDVASVVARLTDGSADAGFLYRTDVLAADDRLRAVDLPPGAQVEATYWVGLVRGFDRGAQARSWQDWLLGPSGRGLLEAAGFDAVEAVLASGPAGE